MLSPTMFTTRPARRSQGLIGGSNAGGGRYLLGMTDVDSFHPLNVRDLQNPSSAKFSSINITISIRPLSICKNA